MDAIRRRQISEALDYDKNMNKRTFSIQKQQVANMSEGPPRAEQIDQGLVSEAHDTINTLLVILDKKKADLTSLLTYAYGPQANESEYTQAVNELYLRPGSPDEPQPMCGILSSIH